MVTKLGFILLNDAFFHRASTIKIYIYIYYMWERIFDLGIEGKEKESWDKAWESEKKKKESKVKVRKTESSVIWNID